RDEPGIAWETNLAHTAKEERGMTNGRHDISAAAGPGRPVPAPGQQATAEIRLPPVFKRVFNAVLILTILSLLVSIALLFVPNQSEEVKRLVETTSTTFKLGFGAVVGLIGGKALQ